MKLLTKHAYGVGCRTMVGLVTLLGGLLTSVYSVQPVLLARTPTLAAVPYHVMLETPQMIFQGQDAVVVVHVQNRHGLPLDGIAVAFQIAPPRTRYASIRPARAHTEDGRVRALLRSELVGQVRITARVGALLRQATITVVMPIARRDG
jgi:hypothetical protein